jgi:DNA (cytosine-5)-methyltransferase 1
MTEGKRNSPASLYVVDLFAGCGGLSEGFKQAGFEILAQVEMDKWACQTLITRHIYYELRKIRKNRAYKNYLKGNISQEEILSENPSIQELVRHRVIRAQFGKEKTDDILNKIEESARIHGASRCHVLLGGPPCQPYSLIGRSRDPFRMSNDERHFLYTYYLEILERLQPDFFVYENVPGLFTAKAKEKDVFRKILSDFSSLHPAYEITPPLIEVSDDPGSYVLNAADFHVPQSRKRLVLIGYRKPLESKNPEIRSLFTLLQKKGIRNRGKGHLTVEDAISDLPSLRPGEGNDGWFGFYVQSDTVKNYQMRMRQGSAGVSNHRARTHMAADLRRYRFFIEHQRNGNGAANLIDLMNERPDLTPEHRTKDKFLDRFKVQWWSKPASTITAHICKDGHYYIHPDIDQCRSFTVREAARCQSFPDNFKFEGPRTEQFKQVGNAVPPMLAFAIARVLITELRKIYDGQNFE